MKRLPAFALFFAGIACCDGEHIDIAKGGSCVSPDKRYAIIIAPVAADKMPDSSAVSLQVRASGKQSVLFHSEAAGRGVDVVWSPDSTQVAINSYEANSGDFLHVFRVSGASTTRVRKPAYEATEKKLLRKHPEFQELERWSIFAKRWRDSNTLESVMRGRFYTARPHRSLETFAFVWLIRFKPHNDFEILSERRVTY
jgi:hypothetical protein